MASDCLFCGIVAGDVPGQIVDSDEHTVAFMDINPATRGHALVVPREHSADLMEISDEDLERDDGRGAAAGQAHGRDARARRLQHPQRLPPGGLADGLPLPHPRHPPLRRRPAEAAVDPARRRARADRRGRRRDPGSGRPRWPRSRLSATAPSPSSPSRTRRSTCSPPTPGASCSTASARSRAPTPGRSSGAPRATSSPAASTSRTSRRSLDAGPESADGFAQPLIDGVRRLEALEIPTLALVHGLCLTAGLEVALGCDMIWAERVGEVRAGRGRRRPHARRRRHAADGRARRARARARVRDDGRPLRRRGARALGRRQPGGRPTTRSTRRGCASPTASPTGPTMAHAATKRIVRAYCEGGVDEADAVTPQQFAEPVRDRGPPERGQVLPRGGAGQGDVRGPLTGLGTPAGA